MRGRRKGRNRSLPPVLLRAVIALVPLLVLFAPSTAHAYAWMFKHGYSGCPVCHADPSGGELLNNYGRQQSVSFLSMRWKKEPETTTSSGGGSDFDSFDSFDSEGSDKDARKMKGKQAGKKVAPEKINLDDEEEEEKPKAKPKAAAPASKAKPEKARPEKAKPKEEEEEEEKGGDDEEGSASGEQEEDEDSETRAAATEGGEAETEVEADLEQPSQFSDFLFGLVRLPPPLLLGGSYRHMNIIRPSGGQVFRTFPMQMDLYGQLQLGMFRANASVGAARVPAGSPFARAAQITTGQEDQWNLISRVHWVGVDLANSAVTVRAGRMNLPFGVRIPEHTMWVRMNTRTDRDSGQQHGVAIAYNGELLRGEIMGIAGNYQINPDEFRERGYSLFAEYLVTPKTALGISSLVTSAANDRVNPEGEPVLRQVHGAMIRAVLSEQAIVMAEADVMLRSRASFGFVGFAQLDYELVQGLHLMGTLEALDNGFPETATERVPGIGKPKLGGWLTANWFFLPHFDVRLDGVLRQEEPFSLYAQLHMYL
jgi:hypothetical protein